MQKILFLDKTGTTFTTVQWEKKTIREMKA